MAVIVGSHGVRESQNAVLQLGGDIPQQVARTIRKSWKRFVHCNCRRLRESIHANGEVLPIPNKKEIKLERVLEKKNSCYELHNDRLFALEI